MKHFIRLGVDIVDPVQTAADAMDARMLKQQFGDKLVFHGVIDTQGVLPVSTPDKLILWSVDKR